MSTDPSSDSATRGAMLTAIPFAARQVEIRLAEGLPGYSPTDYLEDYARYFDRHADDYECAKVSLEAASSIALARTRARIPGFNDAGSIIEAAEGLMRTVPEPMPRRLHHAVKR